MAIYSCLRTFVCVNGLALAALQCGGSATPSSNTAASAPEPNGAASQVAAGPTSDTGSATAELTDGEIAAITDKANTAEIEQARLAQSKATDERVRSFAGMMVTHHGEAKQKQAGLNLSPAESTQSQQLSEEASATLQKLRDKSGPEFDRAYMDAQVEAHEKVLDVLNRELLPNAKDPQLRAYLEEIKPTIEQHLEQAKKYQKALESTSQNSSTSSPQATRNPQ